MFMRQSLTLHLPSSEAIELASITVLSQQTQYHWSALGCCAFASDNFLNLPPAACSAAYDKQTAQVSRVLWRTV